MTGQNENSPLARNVSGQELKTVEARSLSGKGNGTSGENFSRQRVPASEHVSEATR